MIKRVYRLKGSTLPEALVALAILSCMIAIAFQAIGPAGNGNLQALQWEAIRQTNNLLYTDYSQTVFTDTLREQPLVFIIIQYPYPDSMLLLRRVEVQHCSGRRLCYRERIMVDSKTN